MTRDVFLDSAKGVLIFLVVLGHLCEFDLSNHSISRSLYVAIYSFHIPAFVFVAGMLSKPGFDVRSILRLALIFFLAQLGYFLFCALLGAQWPRSILQPYWILWFLVSLISWRSLFPLMPRSAWVLVFITAGSLGIGWCPWVGYDFSFHRSIYFFPFFLVGQWWGREIIEKINRYRFLSIFFFLIVILSAVCLDQAGMDYRLWYGSLSYSGSGIVETVVLQSGLFFLSSIATVCFFCLVPKHYVSASIGRRSLNIYLCHGIPLVWLHGALSL